jgi:hypothetical protein
VERLELGRESEWAQVTRNAHGLYEFRSDQNIRYTSSLPNVHEFMTRWAFDLPE